MAENVTVPLMTEPVTVVVGGTPASVFSFGFPFWSSEDIVVLVGGVRQLSTAYTVQGLFVQNGVAVEGGYGSGTVTLNAPVTNTTVVIDRRVAPVRNAQFSRASPVPAAAQNADQNRQVARQQDLERRAVQIAPGDSGPPLTVPATRAETILGFNAARTMVALPVSRVLAEIGVEIEDEGFWAAGSPVGDEGVWG